MEEFLDRGYCSRFRYWPQDLYSLNSHFGTGEGLKALVDALHKQSMYLVVDAGSTISARHIPPSFSTFYPFNDESYFHPKCPITDYNNPTRGERCWLGDDKLTLADVDTEEDEIIKTYYV